MDDLRMLGRLLHRRIQHAQSSPWDTAPLRNGREDRIHGLPQLHCAMNGGLRMSGRLRGQSQKPLRLLWGQGSGLLSPSQQVRIAVEQFLFVSWRGAVIHRVDEVETEIPPREFELRPVIGLGHCGSDKRSI